MAKTTIKVKPKNIFDSEIPNILYLNISTMQNIGFNFVIICKDSGTKVMEWKTPPKNTKGVIMKLEKMFN